MTLVQIRVNLEASSLPFFATAFFSFSSAVANSFDSVVVVVEAGEVDFEGDEGEGARKGREVVKSRSCSDRFAYGVSDASDLVGVLLSRGANRACTKGESGDVEVRQVDEASRNHACAEIGWRAILDGEYSI